MDYLSRHEEMVLLAVYHLKNDASLVSVRRYLNKTTEKRWTMSSVFIPLDRLKKSGLLDMTIGDPTPKRGGRAKKFYTLTRAGLESLLKVQKVNNTLWDGLSGLSEELNYDAR